MNPNYVVLGFATLIICMMVAFGVGRFWQWVHSPSVPAPKPWRFQCDWCGHAETFEPSNGLQEAVAGRSMRMHQETCVKGPVSELRRKLRETEITLVATQTNHQFRVEEVAKLHNSLRTLRGPLEDLIGGALGHPGSVSDGMLIETAMSKYRIACNEIQNLKVSIEGAEESGRNLRAELDKAGIIARRAQLAASVLIGEMDQCTITARDEGEEDRP